MSESLRLIALEIERIRSENARLLERLVEGERRFRMVSRGVLRVQEAERARLSRDLHDGIGQSLTALKLQLEMAQRALDDPGLGGRLREIRDLADRCLQDVRHISHQIRPQILDELGLVPTLRWLARGVARSAGIEVEFVESGESGAADPDAETLLFRVAQEALTNVAKHASARGAELRLSHEPGRVVLEVCDSGRGFDSGAALAQAAGDGGFGLRGMRDRVQLLGGRFTVSSRPGEGCVVRVELPLEQGASGRRE